MMRRFIASALGCAALVSAACNPAATTNSTVSTTTNATSPAASPTTTTTAAPTPTGDMPPVSSAHGGPAPAAANSGGPAAGPEERPEGVDTAALDSKIGNLEPKARAGSASAADKKALAEAYLQRANLYRDAGNPRLYKFALGDYRRVLHYDPTNAEAKAKMDEIVSIYNSMGRPVPTNGLEQ